MKLPTTASILTRLLLAVVFSSSPLAAQQKRGTTPRKPAPAPPVVQPAEPGPTFDTLLADDSYKVYVEVRGVGQLLRSPAVNDLLEPVTKIVGPSKEFNTVLKWLDAHADSLAGSRLFVASWPTQTSLPAVLLAIEFASPEEALKFEPQLRRFIPKLLPAPEPTPMPRAGQPPTVPVPSVPPASAGNSFPYHITHTGSLVLLSDKPFSFRDLKPRQAKLLAEDQNFVTARNRFASESLFLYVDVKAIEKEDEDRRKKYEEEDRRLNEKNLRSKQEQASSSSEIAEPTVVEATAIPTPEEPQPTPTNDTAMLTAPPQVQTPTGTLSGQESNTDSALMSTLTYSLYGGLFGGRPKWPEAVAAALAFEGEAYVLRALILNSGDNKPVAVPFLPQLVSGPALIPAAPAVLPADADLFISASLEYPQMYDGLLKSITGINDRGRAYAMQAVSDAPVVSPFAEFEKKLGLKIRDDILPLLGNELGVALVPKRADGDSASPSATPAADTQQKVKPYDPDPIVAIAVRDKDAVRHLIPKLIEAMGLKGANLIAQTERKDDTETTTYAGLFSYAFVGDFLILSPNPAVVKGAVASYLAGETLSSNSYFRNASRWQSRQVQAQVYLAPVLVQRYGPGGTNSVNEKTAELLSHVNLPIEPLTYSLSNEGSGPLHELHFPKNLLLLMMASFSNDGTSTPLKANETAVKNELRTIVGAEATYQATIGDGRYGTIDELVKAGLLSKEPIERYGYEIELTVSANKFEATAVPIEYGKSGSLSYFVDESGVVRGGDRAGGPATIADPPVQ